MTKYYVSDRWNDTQGHFFMYNTGYSYRNYPAIQLNQPATDHKRSYEQNVTYPQHCYGFLVAHQVQLKGDTITIEGWFGAYHGYNSTRANFRWFIAPSSYLDKDQVPPSWIMVGINMSRAGWSNGSYNRYAKIKFKINPDNTITVIEKTPDAWSIGSSNPYGLINETISVIFGYYDAWTSDWNQWASAHKNSYIDLPVGVAHEVSITDVGKASDSLRKTSIKKLVDTSKGLDYFSRTVSFHLDIVDIGEVEDYVSKQPKIIISDYSSISDYLNRGFLRALRDYASLCEYINFGYYVSLIDRVFGDFDFTTIRGKVLREVVKGIDRIVKKPTVMLIDSAEAFDYIQPSASFHVTLTDAGKLLDYISKIASRYIVLTDSSKLIDLISKIPSINIRDSSSVYDVTRKSTVRLLRDLSSVGDYISKSLSKMLMDRVYGDFDFRKISVYVRELADSSKVADWHVKETVKYMAETITSIDYLSKNIGKKIADATTSLDYISTIGAFHVTLHDASRTADKILKEYGKNLADSITASDYVLKNITHVILDVVKSIDFTSSSITLILRDSVFGDFYASRLLGKEITDAVKAVDVRAVWDLAKILREYVTVRDSPYRTVIITLIDRVFHDIETSKGIGYSLRDEVTALDRLLRVAFTICGYELRRVFMDDIILPDDHNLKVAVCNCLLNAIKRIKEILESHS